MSSTHAAWIVLLATSAGDFVSEGHAPDHQVPRLSYLKGGAADGHVYMMKNKGGASPGPEPLWWLGTYSDGSLWASFRHEADAVPLLFKAFTNSTLTKIGRPSTKNDALASKQMLLDWCGTKCNVMLDIKHWEVCELADGAIDGLGRVKDSKSKKPSYYSCFVGATCNPALRSTSSCYKLKDVRPDGKWLGTKGAADPWLRATYSEADASVIELNHDAKNASHYTLFSVNDAMWVSYTTNTYMMLPYLQIRAWYMSEDDAMRVELHPVQEMQGPTHPPRPAVEKMSWEHGVMGCVGISLLAIMCGLASLYYASSGSLEAILRFVAVVLQSCTVSFLVHGALAATQKFVALTVVGLLISCCGWRPRPLGFLKGIAVAASHLACLMRLYTTLKVPYLAWTFHALVVVMALADAAPLAHLSRRFKHAVRPADWLLFSSLIIHGIAQVFGLTTGESFGRHAYLLYLNFIFSLAAMHEVRAWHEERAAISADGVLTLLTFCFFGSSLLPGVFVSQVYPQWRYQNVLMDVASFAILFVNAAAVWKWSNIASDMRVSPSESVPMRETLSSETREFTMNTADSVMGKISSHVLEESRPKLKDLLLLVGWERKLFEGVKATGKYVGRWRIHAKITFCSSLFSGFALAVNIKNPETLPAEQQMKQVFCQAGLAFAILICLTCMSSLLRDHWQLTTKEERTILFMDRHFRIITTAKGIMTMLKVMTNAILFMYDRPAEITDLWTWTHLFLILSTSLSLLVNTGFVVLKFVKSVAREIQYPNATAVAAVMLWVCSKGGMTVLFVSTFTHNLFPYISDELVVIVSSSALCFALATPIYNELARLAQDPENSYGAVPSADGVRASADVGICACLWCLVMMGNVTHPSDQHAVAKWNQSVWGWYSTMFCLAGIVVSLIILVFALGFRTPVAEAETNQQEHWRFSQNVVVPIE